MREPAWIVKSVALALHDEQLAEHGGQDGLRDEAVLDSALDRPKNQLAYGDPTFSTSLPPTQSASSGTIHS